MVKLIIFIIASTHVTYGTPLILHNVDANTSFEKGVIGQHLGNNMIPIISFEVNIDWKGNHWICHSHLL